MYQVTFRSTGNATPADQSITNLSCAEHASFLFHTQMQEEQ